MKPSNHSLRVCESRELGQGLYDEVNGRFRYCGSVYASPSPNKTLPVASTSPMAARYRRNSSQSISSTVTSSVYSDDDTLREVVGRRRSNSLDSRKCDDVRSSFYSYDSNSMHQASFVQLTGARESKCTTVTMLFARELEGDVFGTPERIVADPAKHKELYIPAEEIPPPSAVPLDASRFRKSPLPHGTVTQTRQSAHPSHNTCGPEFLQHDPYDCRSAASRTSHMTTATSLFGGDLLGDVFAAAPMNTVDVAKHRELYLPPVLEIPKKLEATRSTPNTTKSTGSSKRLARSMQIQPRVPRSRVDNQPKSNTGPAPITKYDYLLMAQPEVDY